MSLLRITRLYRVTFESDEKYNFTISKIVVEAYVSQMTNRFCSFHFRSDKKTKRM